MTGVAVPRDLFGKILRLIDDLRSSGKRNILRRLVLTVVLLVVFAAPIQAHDAVPKFEEGIAAAKRGDHATALRVFKAHAALGNSTAQFNLGIIYENGLSVPQDYAAAVKWYSKAAEQGNADAQNNLGVMYGNGYGVPQGYVEAHMWYNLATAQENETARKNRDIVAKQMTPTQIAEAQKVAREWMKKHGQ